MTVELVDYRYVAISPIIIREDHATLERDEWYESVFGRCPVIVELEQRHLVTRWERVRRRWNAKRDRLLRENDEIRAAIAFAEAPAP